MEQRLRTGGNLCSAIWTGGAIRRWGVRQNGAFLGHSCRRNQRSNPSDREKPRHRKSLRTLRTLSHDATKVAHTRLMRKFATAAENTLRKCSNLLPSRPAGHLATWRRTVFAVVPEGTGPPLGSCRGTEIRLNSGAWLPSHHFSRSGASFTYRAKTWETGRRSWPRSNGPTASCCPSSVSRLPILASLPSGYSTSTIAAARSSSGSLRARKRVSASKTGSRPTIGTSAHEFLAKRYSESHSPRQRRSIWGCPFKIVYAHLHHTINCLVGPGGKTFDARALNPCKDLGNDSADAAQKKRPAGAPSTTRGRGSRPPSSQQRRRMPASLAAMPK